MIEIHQSMGANSAPGWAGMGVQYSPMLELTSTFAPPSDDTVLKAALLHIPYSSTTCYDCTAVLSDDL